MDEGSYWSEARVTDGPPEMRCFMTVAEMPALVQYASSPLTETERTLVWVVDGFDTMGIGVPPSSGSLMTQPQVQPAPKDSAQYTLVESTAISTASSSPVIR